MIAKKCNHSLCHQVKNKTLPDDSYKALLKENNLTITKPRMAVLKVLMENSLPMTVEEIMKKMHKGDSCDLATIYRVVGQFSEANLVNTIHLEKDLVHYEYNNPFHHYHHVICNHCKKVEIIEECFLDQIEISLAKKGYTNLGHRLQFFGLCKNCQAA